MSESTPFYRMAEFWIMVIDAVINIILLILNEYAPGQVVEITQQIIVWVQPIVVLIVVSMLGERVSNAVKNIAMQIMAGRLKK